jgi:hypothetical protein
MDLLDTLAFWGRKYEKQKVPRTGSFRFALSDLMEMFDRNAIYELTPVIKGKPGQTVAPDPVKKMKVSLLDNGISAIHSGPQDWYEVVRTAPSGDLSRVRIIAHASGGGDLGEIRMLVGQRSYDHYFREDPLFAEMQRREPGA